MWQVIAGRDEKRDPRQPTHLEIPEYSKSVSISVAQKDIGFQTKLHIFRFSRLIDVFYKTVFTLKHILAFLLNILLWIEHGSVCSCLTSDPYVCCWPLGFWFKQWSTCLSLMQMMSQLLLIKPLHRILYKKKHSRERYICEFYVETCTASISSRKLFISSVLLFLLSEPWKFLALKTFLPLIFFSSTVF